MKTEVKTQKRFWRRGNVLDVVILLLILAAIASIGYRYYTTTRAADADELDDYVITFRAEGVLPGVVDVLREEEALYLSGGETLGTLERIPGAMDTAPVISQPTKATLQDSQGNYVSVARPDRAYLDVEGSVSCRGLQDEQGLFLLNGNKPVTPGQMLTVYTEKATMTVLVTAVKKD